MHNNRVIDMLRWEQIKRTTISVIKWTWVIVITLLIILWIVKEIIGIKAIFV
jgi:uncharacterized Rmd1/YagE family protein